MPRAGRDFVTGDDMPRNDNPGGRPRKYASDADRQKAYRERWGRINVRVEARTEEVVRTMARAIDATDGDIVNAALKYYSINFNWRTGIYGRALPTIQDKETRAEIERKKQQQELLNDPGFDITDPMRAAFSEYAARKISYDSGEATGARFAGELERARKDAIKEIKKRTKGVDDPAFIRRWETLSSEFLKSED